MRVHPSLQRRVKVSLGVKASVDVPHYRARCHFWQIDPRFFFFVRSSASRESTTSDDDRETRRASGGHGEWRRLGLRSPDRLIRFDLFHGGFEGKFVEWIICFVKSMQCWQCTIVSIDVLLYERTRRSRN